MCKLLLELKRSTLVTSEAVLPAWSWISVYNHHILCVLYIHREETVREILLSLPWQRHPLFSLGLWNGQSLVIWSSGPMERGVRKAVWGKVLLCLIHWMNSTSNPQNTPSNPKSPPLTSNAKYNFFCPLNHLHLCSEAHFCFWWHYTFYWARHAHKHALRQSSQDLAGYSRRSRILCYWRGRIGKNDWEKICHASHPPPPLCWGERERERGKTSARPAGLLQQETGAMTNKTWCGKQLTHSTMTPSHGQCHRLQPAAICLILIKVWLSVSNIKSWSELVGFKDLLRD